MKSYILTLKAAMALVFFTLFLIPGFSLASDVNFSIPCNEGGEIVFNGSLDSSTGAFDLAITCSECIQNGVSVAGTGTVTGTFEFAIIPTSVSLSAETDFQGTLTQGEDSVDVEFGKVVDGTYDLISGKLNGNIESTWSASGEISISLVELLSIDRTEALFNIK